MAGSCQSSSPECPWPLCAAHADCLDLAPHAFALDDEEIAITTGPATLEDLTRAAEGCPSVAISVVDADTGEQLYP
jgi:ferredoxin